MQSEPQLREQITARILVTLKRQIEERAVREKRSVSQIIEMLLESALANGKKK